MKNLFLITHREVEDRKQWVDMVDSIYRIGEYDVKVIGNGCYLIKSELTEHRIALDFEKCAKGVGFMVVEIPDPSRIAGCQRESIWEWLGLRVEDFTKGFGQPKQRVLEVAGAV